MGKVKILLKKSTNIGASALLLVSTLLPTLALKGQSVVSAATATTSLTPGGTVDTGNHTWGLSDFQTASNYTPVGKNTSGSGWTSSSTYNFGTYQANTGSWLPFNGAVDMTHSITISGATFANAGGINPATHLGDANGILLTNLASSQLSGGATGGNLGVGNLGSGTYFIGNNYSHTPYYTLLDLTQGYQTASVVAQGDGSGAKILSASSDYTPNNNSTNAFSMSWTNPVLNSNGTVTGTISYTSRNAGTDYTTSTSITVQKSMSIGFMAATGGNYAQMSVTVSGVTAGKGVQPVNVNYLNTATGSQLAPKGTAWQNSTISANVGDKIGVVAPSGSGNAADNYDYFAPVAPAGYSFSSVSQPVTVQNFPSGTTNPNQINVSYTPQPQTAGFTYSYDPTAQRTPTTPPLFSASGVTDQTLVAAAPNLQMNLAGQVPAGYYISKITSALGGTTVGSTTAGTLSSFFALNPTFDAVASNNQYQITLSALNQTGTVSFVYDTNVPAGAPTLPVSLALSGLTGSDLNFVMPNLPAGYAVSNVLAPNNVNYSSVAAALAANNYFIAGINNFKVTISAMAQSGTVSYSWASDVPGQNGVAGELQATLPSTTSLAGVTGGAISFTPTIPTGYGIDTVTAPDGKTYTDTTTPGMTALQAAQAANPTFVNGANNFTISLKALMQKVELNVVADQASGPNPPTNPDSQTITTALTGAPVSMTDIASAQNWLNNWMTNNATGWAIKDYVDPDGQSYTDSMKSLAEAVSGAGGVVLAGDNTYTVNLTYNGSISFVSVPSTIDFGSHSIVSSEEDYTGALDQSVVVSDTRATSLLTPWTVSVAQTSPIQEVTQNGTDGSGDPIYVPVTDGISFMNYLSYDGTVLTDNPETIYSTTTAATGTTTVIDAGASSLFKLSVPVDFQKSNTNFEGSLTWTLTSAP
ncbi:MAG: WxL domain-containing protein [Streptococcaceae bacterium]|nr:WxL domain-containing protein [Streptococcaceae bacterium]